jgi:hypothetical protein
VRARRRRAGLRMPLLLCCRHVMPRTRGKGGSRREYQRPRSLRRGEGPGLFVGAGFNPARGSITTNPCRSIGQRRARDDEKADTVRYTADEIAAKLARDESRTDWARVDAISRDEGEHLADDEDGELEAG